MCNFFLSIYLWYEVIKRVNTVDRPREKVGEFKSELCNNTIFQPLNISWCLLSLPSENVT